MGLEIDRERFSEEDRRCFAGRLQQGVAALEALCARPGFGAGPISIGMEVEMALVDGTGRPFGANRQVRAATVRPGVALEVDRFNIEYASDPRPLAGAPFSGLAGEIGAALAEIDAGAAATGGRIALVGTLPTLSRDDLHVDALTDAPRYRALSNELRRARDRPFRVRVDGDEPIDVSSDDVTLEGAGSSVQVHLRVPPERFASTYNAAQIASAAALSVAGNSPVLLGHLLWEETRVALFQQAVDDRTLMAGWRPGRVSFGTGWCRRGAPELFAESVALHLPLLPIPGDDDEDPVASVARGDVPQLIELRMHHGTVWTWNRAVYGPDGGGSVRIEMRALPSGPTVGDMVANAAFLVGLTLGLEPEAGWMTAALPFRHAEANFYAAARRGLEAKLLWPSPEAPSPRVEPARRLVRRLIPVARRGLVDHGVDAAEAEALLEPVAARVESGLTGARWQRLALGQDGEAPRAEALREMLDAYLTMQSTGRPVAAWPVPDPVGAG
ncbi:MAG: glutamate-cysteine ligase family protein [Thermoleophilia bacterium]|nr:glutamate-cysteine ligase family protein [Thermoleophilia bacterium]